MTRLLKLLLLSSIAVFALAGQALAGQAIYTNSYFNKQIVGLSLGATGTPTPFPGSPFTVDDHFLDAIGMSPDGRLAIVDSAQESSIGTRALSDEGIPASVGPETASSVLKPPAVSPNGKFVYATANPQGLLGFSIGAGGSLTQLGPPVGTGLFGVTALTPDGRFAYMTDTAVNQIQRFSIGADGRLTELTPPASVNGPYAKGIQITPDGRYAIVLIEQGGISALVGYSIGGDGSLTEISPELTVPDEHATGPVISPNGRFAYVAMYNAEEIFAAEIQPNGKLKEIGNFSAGMKELGGMAISPDGRFLYVQPEEGGELQAMSIAADGSLTKLGERVQTDGGSDHTTPVPRPAVPRAAIRHGEALPGQKTAFLAAGSTDIGATITGYEWNFGDGSHETTTAAATEHVYAKGGLYHATVTVLDDVGCRGFVYTGQYAYCNGTEGTASVPVDTFPVISGLGAKKKKKKVTLEYGLEEPASMEFTIQRKKGKKLVTVGVLTAQGVSGANSTKVPQKLKGKKLKPGSYGVVAIATDSAGQQRSSPAVTSFKLKKPHHKEEAPPPLSGPDRP